MSRESFAVALIAVVAGPLSAAQSLDIAALSKQLDHDDFVVRERAERQLLEHGKSLLESAFAEITPPAEAPYGTDLSTWFDEILKSAEANLKRELYDRVAPGLDLEGQFRLQRLRRGLSGEIDERILSIRAKYPAKLPEDQAKLVHGYTGGFRGTEKWFDASYRNGSQFAVTAVRIRLRLEHKQKKVEQEVLLGPSSKPIPPGGSATWSAEVEQPRGATYDFYWQTVAVYGYPVTKR